MSDTNWDEIRTEDPLRGPVYESRHRNGHVYSSTDAVDAPLLGDEAYTEIPMVHTSVEGSPHCHWRSHADTPNAAPQLIAAIVMCAIFMVCELIGGWLAGSIAVMSDAAHLLTDCASFGLALAAVYLARRPPNTTMSYGYKRAEVLGAMISVLLIWLLTGAFVYVAALRLWQGDYDIDARRMMLVSGLGVLINVLMALILHGSCSRIGHLHSHGGCAHSHAPSPPDLDCTAVAGEAARRYQLASFRYVDEGLKETEDGRRECGGSSGYQTSDGRLTSRTDASASTFLCHTESVSDFATVKHEKPESSINLRAAMIHVIGDLIQSIGVFIAAVTIYFYPNAKIVDPLCTFMFSIIVMLTTVRILKEATEVLMEGVPSQIKYDAVLSELQAISGVMSVHSLHIWALTNQTNILTAHLAIDQYTDPESVLQRALELLRSRYPVTSVTLQVERHRPVMADCSLCSAHARL